MMFQIAHICFLLLFIYLSINIGYLLFMAVAGHFFKKKATVQLSAKKRIAVLITSHREDEVIVNTVRQAVAHDYPTDHFQVYVAADHLQPSTIQQLRQLNATIYEVNFEKGSKARSLSYLLNTIPETQYDIALVLDGDNIMLPGFMENINIAFQQHASAVQGHRTAKNLNTPVAILDAISEEINNHLFRKAQSALGFSAATIGSGMAFGFQKLKEVYNKPGITDNPACDREVDFEMMKAGIVVEYISDARLLDEKVSNRQVFRNQRRRWLESQIVHLRLFFSEKVPHKTKDYWNKLFINLIPPRIIFLAVFFILGIIVLTEKIYTLSLTGIVPCAWLMLFFLYIICLIIAVPRSFYTIRTLRSLLYLPVIMFLFIKAAFTMRSRRKEFVHTPKTFTDTSRSAQNK